MRIDSQTGFELVTEWATSPLRVQATKTGFGLPWPSTGRANGESRTRYQPDLRSRSPPQVVEVGTRYSSSRLSVGPLEAFREKELLEPMAADVLFT